MVVQREENLDSEQIQIFRILFYKKTRMGFTFKKCIIR